MKKELIEQTIKEFLISRKEVIFAYIFGSFKLKEKYNDIDIAVYLDPEYKFNDLRTYPFGYESELLGNLNLLLKSDKIDLVLLNKANILISVQVFNEGKLLFEKDRFQRVKIENGVRKEYLDTEHFRKIKTYYLKNHLNVQ